MQALQCWWLLENHQRLGKARNRFSLTVLRSFKATLPTLRLGTSSLYKCQDSKFLLLSHAVFGAFLQHPGILAEGDVWRNSKYCSHLMSPQQGGPPIHVVLWLDHIYHLVGIQLESTLQFIQAIRILHGLLAVSFLPFLFLLLSTTLTLPDPPQIPTKQQSPAAWEFLQIQIPMTAPPPNFSLLYAFMKLITTTYI